MKILLVLFYLVVSVRTIQGLVDYEYDINALQEEPDELARGSSIAVRWKDLGWKILCEEEEWKSQFESIKNELSKCLQISKIIYDHEVSEKATRKLDYSLAFEKSGENSHCMLAKNWKNCFHLLNGIDCIEPNPKDLVSETRRIQYKQIMKDVQEDTEAIDAYDWRIMTKPYKILCAVATAYSKANPMQFLGAF